MNPNNWRTSTWVLIVVEVLAILMLAQGFIGNEDDTFRAWVALIGLLGFIFAPIIFAVFRSVRGTPDSRGGDPLDALDKLAALKERGAITPEEYESKKAALLQKVR